jgi:hypothetical protein
MIIHLQHDGLDHPVPVIRMCQMGSLHGEAQIHRVGKRGDGSRARHIDEGDIASAPPTGTIWVALGHFAAGDDRHAAQAMRPPLPYSFHHSSGDPRVGCAGSLHLDLGLDDVPHADDAD